MTELELTRTPGDRRAYALDGVGTLRLTGWGSSGATAEADGRSWTFARRGVVRKTTEAVDAAGAVCGTFVGNQLRRGGRLTWGEDEYVLRSASLSRERYALAAAGADDADEAPTFEGRSWGRRPVKVTVADPGALDPGLLLFTAFVVRGLAADAGASAGASTGAAAG